MLALRSAYLLALVIWLGGIVVLGALVAPTTFAVLQASAPEAGRALAGEVFGTVVARFHYVEYAAGAVLLVSLAAMRLLGPKPPGFAVRTAIVIAMLGVAIYSGTVVLGGIDAIQQDVGMLPSRLAADDPRRLAFDGLHQVSEYLMLVDLLGAVALLYWEARE
jgi:uncharacterized membrane protein